MAETSIRGNTIPAGGATATTQASQAQPLLPDTFTLKRLTEQFQEASEINVIQLNQQAIVPGQVANFVINNVGLGQDLELWVEGSVTLNKSDAGAQVLNFSPEFPFNLISNINVQFNGQTVIANLSGYELLGIMSKRNKGVIQGEGASAGVAFSQPLARVDKTIAYATAGAGATFTTGNGLVGVASVSCQASGDSVINFGFYLDLPFVVRRDLLLGLIPMQNNSVYCNVSITSPALLGATAASPLYGTVAATTSVKSTAIVAKPQYNFWAIPVPNNAKLYSYLVSHSYLLLSQGNNALSKTGAEALQYGMPNNYYLLSLLATIRDSNAALIDVYSSTAGLDNMYLNYNGTARIDRRGMRSRFARDTIYREAIAYLPGQVLMDMTDADLNSNGLNTTKWLNMYLANNPQLVADVQASYSSPGSFSILREQLVPAQVNLV
jgi:hypothetical protein